MSNECSTVVWKRDFGTPVRKVIAAKLADHADDEGRGIWPSVERTAAQCNSSCRTVQRTLAAFVSEGILRVVSEGGRGPGSTRRYDFDMAVLRSLPLAMPTPESKGDKAENVENKGDTVSPLDDGKGDTDDAKGDTDDAKGCHGVTQTIKEPPIEPSLERAHEREADSAKVGDKGFERAFAAWPTFVSDSKPAAKKAWEGLATADRLAAVKRQAEYVATVKATGRSKFCAYAVYLTEKRWEKLAELPVAPKVAVAPAFGPAWGAVRMERLLAGPISLGPPEVTRESRMASYQAMIKLWNVDRAQAYYRKMGHDFAPDGTMVFADDFDASQALAHRLAKGFPEVNALHEGRALSGAEAEHGTGLAALMEFVQADTPRFEDWRRLHGELGWPWAPTFDRMRGVYFPAGGPEQLETFERVVRGDEHGA